ncbi:MAG: DUF559 domain-containing protein [Hyphomicrobium sp.]|nr:DUF559 domain-containing protein [Hyphomicrobium sp.]
MTEQLAKIARRLRRRQTEEERKLWARLRDRRLNGLKFRRQAPCGPFIADFLCEQVRLIIELDGSQHAREEHARADEERSQALKALGYEVIRIWNAEIKNNIEGVLDGILDAVRKRPQPPHPPFGHLLPKGEGRGRLDALSSPGTGEDVAKRQVRDLPTTTENNPVIGTGTTK